MSNITNNLGQNGFLLCGMTEYSESTPQVFLPAAGKRLSSGNTRHRGFNGNYWSSKILNSSDSYTLLFGRNAAFMSNSQRSSGLSIRCVQDSSQSDIIEDDAVNLSKNGTANCYIVTESGYYKFNPTRGNCDKPLEEIATVEVLWETEPSVGDLIKNVSYKNGSIFFNTRAFKEGNAVIAAKDNSGKILWSWHIWLTDQPHGQVYFNNAGVMMDRNLGATSTTPGDINARGLLYQWGRKDPFLRTESTFWPPCVESDSSSGTIEYTIEHPMTFIYSNKKNHDWYYTGTSLTDSTRWQHSKHSKSIYDPCPHGWRVPDGGNNGIWFKAVGSSSSVIDYSFIDTDKGGINFSNIFGLDDIIWYPASGERGRSNNDMIGYYGNYWSSSITDDKDDRRRNFAHCLEFTYYGMIYLSSADNRALGKSVRCVKEN